MDTLSFPADEKLVKKAVAANEKANPDIHTFTGRVVSGDQFISDKDVKERISSLFHPMTTARLWIIQRLKRRQLPTV